MSDKVIEVDNLPRDIVAGGVYAIKQSNPNSYTHGMFKYPCKFIPEIPRWAINQYLNGNQGVIFDPFSGSGTTLLEANINGYPAWGAEIDDIAKLIIKVKTTKLSKDQFKHLDTEFENIVECLFDSNREAYRPLIHNLEHWFSKETMDELGRMKCRIDEIIEPDIKNFFQLCMVSIVKRVSNADDTSPKPYVSNKIIKTPPPVKKEFTAAYGRYKQMMSELMTVDLMGETSIIKGDALNFKLPQNIDLAITSPPYINAFDYGRTMRLENLWLATLTEEELRNKKKEYVGTEKIAVKVEVEDLGILQRSEHLKLYYDKIKQVDERRALIVKKFFNDMENNLSLMYSQLNTNGKYMIVIGNSVIRKVTVESWKVLEELGHSIGFTTVKQYSYMIQNPYIRIPRKGKGGEISKDYVLVLEKGGS